MGKTTKQGYAVGQLVVMLPKGNRQLSAEAEHSLVFQIVLHTWEWFNELRRFAGLCRLCVKTIQMEWRKVLI